MFREILQIIPKVSTAALNQMERLLNSRFIRISKKFGKGLLTAIKGGGIAGIAIGVVERLLNPLNEVRDSMQRVLGQADEIATFADEFNTSKGELFKLQALAGAKGVSPETLFQLLNKFQTAVSEAARNPNEPSAVRNFAKDKNIAESFFQFIQSLGDIKDKNQQVAIQRQVFGEKLNLRTSEFFNTKDFNALANQIGLKDAAFYESVLNRTSKLSDFEEVLRTRRGVDEFIGKANQISVPTLFANDANLRTTLQKEIERLGRFDRFARVDSNVQKILGELERMTQLLLNVLADKGVSQALDDFKKTGLFRLFNFVDKVD